jgi:hypothetical protein
MADGGDVRVTNALLDERLRHLTQLFKDYCARNTDDQRQIITQLKSLNGTVRQNSDSILVQDGRVKHLEDWKDVVEAWRSGLLATAFKWASLGLGIGAGAVLVVYGIGRAVGVW